MFLDDAYSFALEYYRDDFRTFVVIVASVTFVLYTATVAISKHITRAHAKFEDAHELINNVEKIKNFKVAVIGTGVSGIGGYQRLFAGRFGTYGLRKRLPNRWLLEIQGRRDLPLRV